VDAHEAHVSMILPPFFWTPLRSHILVAGTVLAGSQLPRGKNCVICMRGLDSYMNKGIDVWLDSLIGCAAHSVDFSNRV
jgi:hypothetical protein